MRTLPLDYELWDIKLDPIGNWTAVSDEAVYCSQSVANAWLLFTNDSYLFPTEGIPWFRDVLGHRAFQNLIEQHLKAAALQVPLVTRCVIEDFKFTDRVVSATGYIYTENGGPYNVRVG